MTRCVRGRTCKPEVYHECNIAGTSDTGGKVRFIPKAGRRKKQTKEFFGSSKRQRTWLLKILRHVCNDLKGSLTTKNNTTLGSMLPCKIRQACLTVLARLTVNH